MHRGYVPIDAALLRQLYVGDTLSTDKIAARLGCTATTIRRRLRRFGIEIRPRGPVSLMRSRPVALTSATAYAVGLAATDGNLSSDRRHMSFVSKDQDLVETFRQCLRLTTPMRTLRTRLGTAVYRVQWCDRRLYDWFLALGLMPAKSLRLGGLAIPDEFLADFFRGCIDGDGTIRVYTDSYHRRKKDRYVYERLYVSLVSASRPFVEWIQTAVNRVAHVSGSIQESKRPGCATDLGTPLCEGRVDPVDPLDVPFAGRPLPRPKARESRAVLIPSRLYFSAPRGAPKGRLAIQ